MSQHKNFHAGEARMQASVGINTAEFDRGVDEAFRPAFSANEFQFVGQRTFSVAASIDKFGRPWASPLVGHAGELLTVENSTTVRIKPRPIDGDPLLDNVRATGDMGVLYFDPSRRRRAKSLGTGTVQPDGSILYKMHRNFGLCVKYIFKRSHDTQSDSPEEISANTSLGQHLLDQDRKQLEASDTIFLASRSDAYGADATHRGGPPGFVTVVNNTTLAIPDYPGNGMFQTLGNLLLEDSIGLLSMDFATGRTVQLTGHGTIQPADDQVQLSQRTLLIAIDEVRSSSTDLGLWADIEPFDLDRVS